jgi:RecJ-like exonuclease
VNYTQLKLKPHYREKLGKLASKHNRSLASMVEWLIDKESVTERCPICDGTGQSRYLGRCPICIGTGEVPVRFPAQRPGS